MTMRRICLLLVALTSGGFAQSPLGEPAEVARLFGYSGNDLVVSDVTATANAQAKRRGIELIAAYQYSSPSNGFLPVSVAVARGGTLLTPQLRMRFEQARAEALAVGRPAPIQTVEALSGVTAFVGSPVFGPGGESWRALVTVPNLGVDLSISVGVPSDKSSFKIDWDSDYGRGMQSEHFWEDRLSRAIAIASRALSSRVMLPVASPGSQSAPTPAPRP
jgi:hypothetical protein